MNLPSTCQCHLPMKNTNLASLPSSTARTEVVESEQTSDPSISARANLMQDAYSLSLGSRVNSLVHEVALPQLLSRDGTYVPKSAVRGDQLRNERHRPWPAMSACTSWMHFTDAHFKCISRMHFADLHQMHVIAFPQTLSCAPR